MAANTPTTNTTLAALAHTFASHFPETLRGPRLLGREAEYPVVTADGDAGDVRQVLRTLAESGSFTPVKEGDMIVELIGEEYRFALEVGWGTVEIINNPCATLHELAAMHERAMAQLLDTTEALGLHVLAYGIQPKQSGSLALMSPKQRYGVLHEVIGDTWLYFTSTASDQLHVDITRDELPLALNIGNLLTPAMIALCGNSPICRSEDSGFCSAREGLMGEIHADSFRHGMTPRPVASIQEWIEMLAQQEFLLNKDHATGRYASVNQGTFAAYAANHSASFEDFLMHEHYIWNSARARTAHGTIELRAACQQPWSSHMSVAAIGLGLIEAAASLQEWLEEQLGPTLWPSLRAYGHEVVRHGLAATEPFPGFLRGVLEQCTAALEDRQFDEAIWLTPLYQRLESRTNPAQAARSAFSSDGLPGLLAQTRIAPATTHKGT